MTFDEEQATVKSILKAVEPIEGWCHPEKVDVLARLVLTYRPAKIFELGVHAGKSLCTLALACKAAGAGHVLGADSWRGDDEVRDIDPDEQPEHHANWKGRDLAPYKQLAEHFIDLLGIGEYTTLLQASSEEAAVQLAGQTFDLIHLDASKGRSQTCRFVELWLPRLKVGGLLVLDDCDWQTGRMAQIQLRRSWGHGPYCRELIEIVPQVGSWFSVLERVR